VSFPVRKISSPTLYETPFSSYGAMTLRYSPEFSFSSIARNFREPRIFTNTSVGFGNTTSGPTMNRFIPFSSSRMQYSSRSSVTASRT
jgi:hypothetical protein